MEETNETDVMGSSGGELNEELRNKVFRLGEVIAERDAILITRGYPGLPYEAACWGVSCTSEE